MDSCVDWRITSIHAKALLLSRVDCRLCRPTPKVHFQSLAACLWVGEKILKTCQSGIGLKLRLFCVNYLRP